MSAVFTPTRYKLSVEDYHKLGVAGVLTEDSRVELIEGELIEMAPLGLKPRADRYASSLPTAQDVLVVIEVSDKTLEYDRGPKLSLYAQHGIPEYWIVDVQAKYIEVFHEPGPNRYVRRFEFGLTDVVSPQATGKTPKT